MTRIVIADDQALFREGLRTLLSTRPDMDVVGEAATGDEAVCPRREVCSPTVVLMDLRMPKVDGIQATARIRERWPEIPVLVLTTFDDDANLFGALRAGAAGYLLKDVSSETLVSAIQAATRGESFLQSTVTGRVVAAFARLMESGGPKAEALVLPLSPREREISGAARQRRLEQGNRRSPQPRRRHRQEPRHQHPHQTRRPGSHPGGHPRPSTRHRVGTIKRQDESTPFSAEPHLLFARFASGHSSRGTRPAARRASKLVTQLAHCSGWPTILTFSARAAIRRRTIRFSLRRCGAATAGRSVAS